MRIRIFRAFASNNSGSYTLVGRFENVADAEEAGRFLADLCARESKWRDDRSSSSPSPLDEVLEALGIVAAPDVRDDDRWPDSSFASAPEVVTLDGQVLVHADYTVTMPRALGAIIYAKKGRVELELDHSHEPLAVTFTFYVANARYDDEAAAQKIAAARIAIDEVLPTPVDTDPSGARPPIAPVWSRGEWGALRLSAVFRSLSEGVMSVRAASAKVGVAVHVKIAELEANDRDPFAVLRGGDRFAPGRHRVVLWSTGARPVHVMRVLREHLACTLPEVLEQVQALPKEIAVDVAPAVAEALAAALRSEGADAEAFVPGVRVPNR